MTLAESRRVEAILAGHADALGPDGPGYRHHVHRVLNLTWALGVVPAEDREAVEVAAAFHDLGIWTHRTFDYLEPSIALAREHLHAVGRGDLVELVAAIIDQHHRVGPYRGDAASSVESFRRADLIDVTRGLIRFGLPPALVRSLYDRWPSAGFHGSLARRALRRLATHPASPLPMVRF